MLKKSLYLAVFVLALAGETFYFARGCVAGLLRLGAERAFYRNDHLAAWSRYNGALAWGGDPQLLETDLVELILFGLDQAEAGIKIDLPLPPERSLPLARELVVKRIRESPHRAYGWSLASDVHVHEARRRRVSEVLDISKLSEEPLDNLLPEDRRAIGALEMAGLLEPFNPVYQDLLVEMFLGFGSVPDAAAHTRRALFAYPDLDSHSYLRRVDLPPDLVKAALAGLDGAQRAGSMVPGVEILYLAGTLALRHRDKPKAEEYFRTVLAEAPDHLGALMAEGQILLGRRDFSSALDLFLRAQRVDERAPRPHYTAGISYAALGEREKAIAAFRKARELGYVEIEVFHALGRLLEAAGQTKEAERQFVAAAHLHPQQREAWLALLDFQLKHGNLRGAQEACSNLSRLGLEKDLLRMRCGTVDGDLL